MISPVEAWVAERTGLGARLGADTLTEWQLARVREGIEYARARSPAYGERLRHVALGAVTSRADLQRVPFLWPEELARAPLAFLCVPQKDVARVTTLATSGTRGVTKRVSFTLQDLSRTVDFFSWGMKALVKRGDRVLILMSGQTEGSIGRLLQSAVARLGVTSEIGLAGWGAHEAIGAARSVECVVGVPQEVTYMCRSDRSLRPRSVLLSADYVPECVVRDIAEAWHCQVFTHYGMTETGFGCAVQCASGQGHHLRDADLLLEIVDPTSGRPVSCGERGEIVVTTLRSEAMPLVRYRTGDMGSMLGGACACGGALPRLGRVEGRVEADVVVAGGEELRIERLDDALFAAPCVRGYQASLSHPGDAATLKLVVDAGEPIDEQELRGRLPSFVCVEVSYAKVDPFSVRSKRRVRVSEEVAD